MENSNEINENTEKLKAKLSIGDEYFFNNGKIILKHIKSVEQQIRECLSQEVVLKKVTRNEKGKEPYVGIQANDLNKKLRDITSKIPNLKKETHVENGIFYHNGKEGFDFSIYDKSYNMNRLRNYYIGTNGIYNGEETIPKMYKELAIRKDEWIKFLFDSVPIHQDSIVEKKSLTIVGEFQFGNWALLYRDLFRLLNADANPGVDFYVYITSTGNLHEKLSSQTVYYQMMQKILKENHIIVKTPIWLIGLDAEIV